GAPPAPAILTAPGTPAASAHTPATPLGAFGPPDPSYGGPAQAATPEGRAPGAPGPAEGQPAGGQPPEGQPAGGRRFALSAAIGGRKRPKALSCTLVLSIAGALAAATTAAVVFHVLPGTGGGGDHS
ncbi:serine/threonine protein kinase, partial [Streptomyces sp. MCAF7]